MGSALGEGTGMGGRGETRYDWSLPSHRHAATHERLRYGVQADDSGCDPDSCVAHTALGVWAMSSGATCADVCSPSCVGGSGKGEREGAWS